MLVVFALMAIAINALVNAQSTDAPMREALFDFYQRLKPAPSRARSPVHIVSIDAESLERMGPWPWPRTLVAQLVDESIEAGAKGVLIAEPLDVPDPLSPETIGDFWLKGAQDNALAEQLQQLPRTDEVLAQSMSNIASASGIAADQYNTHNDIPSERADLTEIDILSSLDNDVEYLGLPSIKVPYRLNQALEAASRPVVLNLAADNDGIIRRSHILWSLNGRPISSLSMEAARLALGATKIELDTDTTSTTTSGKRPIGFNIDDQKINLYANGTLYHYPPRRSNISSTAAWKLLDNSASRQPFKDSVILIGRNMETAASVRTPRGRLAPVTVHAMTADQIANGISLKRPIWIGYIEAIAVMLFGATAIIAAQRIMFWQAIMLAIGASLLLFGISASIFSMQSYLLSPILPSIAMFVGILSVAGGKSVGTVLFDDNIRTAFKGMLPEPAMRALRDDRTQSILKGANRKISVLSCELRITDEDLNSLTDNPEYVSEIMATASHNLRNIILNIGGVVDQAEGGRLYAYFNAPVETADHVEKACAAALAMIEGMDKTNIVLAGTRQTAHIQVHLAIGIASGPCFTGSMGHGRNNRYSAIGQAVDLAQLLRRQSEYYGPAIICEDQIYRDSHHKYAFLEVDRLHIDNEERPLQVHALIGNPFIKSSKSFRELESSHRAMIQAYRAGKDEDAQKHLEAVRKFPAAKISLYDIYEERIQSLKEEGAGPNWDGTHEPKL